MMGLGSKAIVKVKSDVEGRMVPAELEKEILKCLANNEVPMIVTSTLGTTV